MTQGLLLPLAKALVNGNAEQATRAQIRLLNYWAREAAQESKSNTATWGIQLTDSIGTNPSQNESGAVQIGAAAVSHRELYGWWFVSIINFDAFYRRFAATTKPNSGLCVVCTIKQGVETYTFGFGQPIEEDALASHLAGLFLRLPSLAERQSLDRLVSELKLQL